MNSRLYRTILRRILQLSCLYMLAEALFHGSGIRTLGMENYWPVSAVVMMRLFISLWASASLVIAVTLFYLQRYLEKATPLLLLITLPAVLHSFVIIVLSFTPYAELLPIPNLYIWSPFYSWMMRLEAAFLCFFSAYIWYGKWKKYL